MNETRAYFADCENNAFIGYSNEEERWNGFATPCFTKRICKEILKNCCDIGEFYHYKFDSKTDTFYIEDLAYDEDNISEYPGRDIIVNNKTIHVYDLFSWVWCWSRHTLNELKNADWFVGGTIYK